MTRSRRRACGLSIVAILVMGCGGEPPEPEAQLRQLVAEAQRAAEAREPGPLKELIADHYADAEGRDAQAIRTLIGFRLLRHGSIHLLTRIDEIELRAPGDASVRLFVAMGGGPIGSLEELAAARASFYRFDFVLEKPEPDVGDGDWESWRVVRAAFRPAVIDDFR